MNIRFLTYSIVLIILGVFIIKTPNVYYVWGYISIACSPAFAALGLANVFDDYKKSKIVKFSGIGLSVLLLLIIFVLYKDDLSYIIK